MAKSKKVTEEQGRTFLKAEKPTPKLFSSASESPAPGSLLKPSKPQTTPEDFGTGDQSNYKNGDMLDPNNAKDPWVHRDAAGNEITVGDLEREEYYISFLHDKPFVWELALGAFDFRVKLRALTPEQVKVIDLAVKGDEDEKLFPNDAGMRAARGVYYSAIMQVLEINSEEFPSGSYRDDSLPIVERVKALREIYDTRFRSMTFARWNAVFQLLRTFETKRAICDSNVANETFWTRVGSNLSRKPASAI